jgi:tetratricopeptide (TPR) repeat protein
MGERGGYVIDLAGLLANALYEQGRFDEAQQLISGACAEPLPSSRPLSGTRLTEAKLLARRGQFGAARRLVDQSQALLSPSSGPADLANVLATRAEVERLAGASGRAAASLRAVQQIYEDRRATILAERARAALAHLTAQPDPEPA